MNAWGVVPKSFSVLNCFIPVNQMRMSWQTSVRQQLSHFTTVSD
jgi:hypothetical protein